MGTIGGMSYTEIDTLYPELTKIEFNSYAAKIGGVVRPWATFNEGSEGSTQKPIVDAVTFANFATPEVNKSTYQESPWKAHLSIHPDDLGKAWDLVAPLLIDKIANFKVSRLSVAKKLLDQMSKVDEAFLQKHHLTEQDKKQSIQDLIRVYHGMQITIYLEVGKELESNKLLQEIETLLLSAGVRPGVIDKSDRAIGIYSSVRHVGKGYTSHDNVTGYKATSEKDPFKAIQIKSTTPIQVDGLDYKRLAFKAQFTLQQVILSKRSYEMGLTDKKAFRQACDVATEFFARWQQLLNNAAGKTDTKAQEHVDFQNFKRWIEHGCAYVPGIRGEKTKKIKEAEDLLSTMTIIDPLSFIGPRKLIRRDAMRNLKDFVEKKPVVIQDNKTPFWSMFIGANGGLFLSGILGILFVHTLIHFVLLVTASFILGALAGYAAQKIQEYFSSTPPAEPVKEATVSDSKQEFKRDSAPSPGNTHYPRLFQPKKMDIDKEDIESELRHVILC